MTPRSQDQEPTRQMQPVEGDRKTESYQDPSERLNELKARIRNRLKLKPSDEIVWSEISDEILLNVQKNANKAEIIFAHRSLIKNFHVDQYQQASPKVLKEISELLVQLNIAKDRLIKQKSEVSDKKGLLSEAEILKLLDTLDSALEFWYANRLGNKNPGRVSPYQVLGIKPGADLERVLEAYNRSISYFYLQFMPLFPKNPKDTPISHSSLAKIFVDLQEIKDQLQLARKKLESLIKSQKDITAELAIFRNPDYQPTIEELIFDLGKLGYARVSANDKSMTGRIQSELIGALHDELEAGDLTLEQIDRYKSFLTSGHDLGFRLRSYVVDKLKIAVAERELIQSKTVLSLDDIEKYLKILVKKYPNLAEEVRRLEAVKQARNQPKVAEKLLLNPETNFVTSDGDMFNNRVYSAVRKDWSTFQRLRHPVPHGLVYLVKE